MSYVTMEVEIEHGKIVPREPKRLPDKGKGILTVLEVEDEGGQPGSMTPLEAFHALQKSLNLDATKAKAWMEMIRDARR